MPRSKLEWTLFVVGLAAAAVLGVLALRHDGRSEPGLAKTPKRTTVTTPRTRPAPKSKPTVRVASAPTTTSRTPRPRKTLVRITARADTWLAVRRSTATGVLLYQGTLVKGASRAFAGDVLWFRFGAAANVSAQLNGKPLALPGGTYSVSVSHNGLGPRRA